MGLPATVHADDAGKCHGQQDITATGKIPIALMLD
jgi:hypothetical protein